MLCPSLSSHSEGVQGAAATPQGVTEGSLPEPGSFGLHKAHKEVTQNSSCGFRTALKHSPELVGAG